MKQKFVEDHSYQYLGRTGNRTLIPRIRISCATFTPFNRGDWKIDEARPREWKVRSNANFAGAACQDTCVGVGLWQVASDYSTSK